MSEDDTQEPGGTQAPNSAPDEADDMLDRLEEPGGMDALIAEFKAEQAGRGRRRQRPVWVPMFVMAIGAYLLWGLWSDAIYAARSDDAVDDLGHAAQLFANGIPEGLDGKQVRLAGTPDVQHVAKRRRKSGQTTGFMRLQEGGGSLFVAVPREDGQDTLEYDGVFVGRMQRMSKLPGFDTLAGYFDRDGIIEVLDAERQSFLDGLGDAGVSTLVSAEEGGGTWTLAPDDEVRLVFRPAIANIQLGRKTWRAEADADAAIEGLGFAWRRAEAKDADLAPRDKSPFRSYQVQMPEGRADATEALLNTIVPADANRADPEIGALVLPTIFAYSVAPTDVRRVDGDTLALVYGDNTAALGIRVEGGALVDRALEGGELHLPLGDLHSVRVERPVRVDPNGYIVIVGELPSDQRINGLLFLIVVGLVVANGIALVMILRRRRRED